MESYEDYRNINRRNSLPHYDGIHQDEAYDDNESEYEPELQFNDQSEADDYSIKPMGSSDENSDIQDDEPLNFDLPDIDPPTISSPTLPQDERTNVVVSPLKKNPKVKSFMEVLNEIYDEKPEIPEKSNLGPKPWLSKNWQKPLSPRNSNGE